MVNSTSAISIANLLTQDRVVFLDQTTKDEALTHMVKVLSQADEVSDHDDLLEKIFSREELMSTGIGMGIGVPHTRIKTVKDLVVAFGVCRSPLTDYQSLDEEPVKLIVMIAAHAEQHAKHLKTLSLITKVLKNVDTYNAILSATSEKEIYQLLTGEL